MDRLVRVVWDDAWADHGWSDETEAGPVTCMSVGFVVQETTKGILLAQSVSQSGFGSMWFVPSDMIVSVYHLKLGETA